MMPNELPPSWLRRSVLREHETEEFYIQRRLQRKKDRAAVIKDWPEWRKSLNHFVKENKWFERAVFVVIALNCVTISTQNFSSLSAYQSGIAMIEHIFTCFFFVEMLTKVIGLGVFVRRGGYFHSLWNVLDFLIVTVSMAAFIIQFFTSSDRANIGLTAIRSFRLLRPLRTLSVLSSLRTILRTIAASLKRLSNVILLTTIFTVAVGLIGLEGFKGALRFRCFDLEAGSDQQESHGAISETVSRSVGLVPTPVATIKAVLDDDFEDRICRWSVKVPPSSFVDWPLPRNESDEAFYAADVFDGAQLRSWDTDLPPVSTSFVCPWGMHCLVHENPEGNYLRFDDILSTVVTLYSVVTLEEWSPVMYYLIDARGWFVTWYFVVVVVVGAVFILNLALAIVTDTFNRISEMERRSRKVVKTSDVSGSETDASRASEKQDEPSTWSGMVLSPELEAAAGGSACFACMSKIRSTVASYVTTRMWFGYVSGTLAIANAATLAMVHHGMPDSWRQAVAFANWGFTALFTVELILKLIAEPIRQFVKDWVNVFDLAVTIASIVEISVAQTAFMSIFRCLRLYRALQMSASLRRTMSTLAMAWKATLSLVLLLVLFIFLFALLGMQLFSGKMCGFDDDSPHRVNTSVCDNVPRTNFDNVGYGIVTTFVIVVGDGWRDIMSDGMAALGDYVSLYFVLGQLVGGLIILNLFVAVLMAASKEVNEKEAKPDSIFADAGAADHTLFVDLKPTFTDPHFSDTAPPAGATIPSGTRDDRRAMSSRTAEVRPPNKDAEWEQELLPSASSQIPDLSAFDMLSNADGEFEELLSVQQAKAQYQKQLENYEAHKCMPRRLAAVLTQSRAFNILILLTIGFAMFTLVVAQPLAAPDAGFIAVFNRWADLLCGIIFALEAAGKTLHLGVWNRPLDGERVALQRGYFQRPSNVYDFVLMLCGLIPLAGFFFRVPYGVVRVFRIFRAFRPLSLIGHYQGIALVFNSIVNAIPNIRNVTCLVLAVWLIFGILGTSLFNGSFYACSDEEWGDISYGGPEIKDRVACLEAGFEWTSPPENFDHLGHSLITLLNVATVDNWDPIMFMAVDSVNHDTAPRAHNKPMVVLYFVSFIVLMTFFLLNFLQSVMIDTYFQTKAKMEANIVHTLRNDELYLTQEQHDFLRMYKRALFFIKPPLHIVIETNSMRGRFRRFIRHRYFDNFFLSIALLHIAIVGSEHAEQPPVFAHTLFILDGVFTAIFCLLTAVRLYVVGAANFFDQKRSYIEVLVNVVAVSTFVAQLIVGDNLICDIVRNVRIFRLYRIAYINADMRLLIETLRSSTRSFIHVLFLYFLLYFTYAVVGTMLFGRVKQHPRNIFGIGPFTNFARFDIALLTLLRIATVDEWAFVMWDCAMEPPDCDPQLGECGWPIVSRIFFTSFIVLGNWIGLNFFTAVLIDSFTHAEREEQYAVQHGDVARFQRLWKQYADSDGSMQTSRLVSFVLHLDAPLGPPRRPSDEERQVPLHRWGLRFVSMLSIPAYGNHVSQEAVFDGLMRHFYGVELPSKIEKQLQRLIRQRFEHKQFERCSPLAKRKACTLREVAGAVIIQSLWRGARLRKVVLEAKRQNGFPSQKVCKSPRKQLTVHQHDCPPPNPLGEDSIRSTASHGYQSSEPNNISFITTILDENVGVVPTRRESDDSRKLSVEDIFTDPLL